MPAKAGALPPARPAMRRSDVPPPEAAGGAAGVVRRLWPAGTLAERLLIGEAPVALTFNGTSHAVMMATPVDLADFATGFALAEGIVPDAGALESLEVLPAAALGGGAGFEVRMWIGEAAMERLRARRRALAGPSGCGLCGLESLDAALPAIAPVTARATFSVAQVMAAVAGLQPAQRLGQATRAAHAAGFWRPGSGLVALREDVGRHNALDKLAGALARAGEDAGDGIVVLTSRVSIELVQKAARLGAPVLAAVSAPTALAVQAAQAAGLTLAGIVRADGCEIFTHPARLGLDEPERRAMREREAMSEREAGGDTGGGDTGSGHAGGGHAGGGHAAAGTARLVRMANQIAQFFAAQHPGPPGEAAAAAAVADHLTSFWEPRMRRGILAYVAAGGTGLSPVAAAAVARLAVPAA